MFASPVLAAVGITGITLTLAAVVTAWVVYLRVTSKLATVILAVTIVLCAMAAFTPRVCWRVLSDHCGVSPHRQPGRRQHHHAQLGRLA